MQTHAKHKLLQVPQTTGRASALQKAHNRDFATHDDCGMAGQPATQAGCREELSESAQQAAGDDHSSNHALIPEVYPGFGSG